MTVINRKEHHDCSVVNNRPKSISQTSKPINKVDYQRGDKPASHISLPDLTALFYVLIRAEISTSINQVGYRVMDTAGIVPVEA